MHRNNSQAAKKLESEKIQKMQTNPQWRTELRFRHSVEG